MTTYPLRIADHIMEEVRTAAAQDNVSLNQLMATFIAEGIGHRRTILAMKNRASRGNVDAAMAVLDKVQDAPTEQGDEL
jgi:hypothetical protein